MDTDKILHDIIPNTHSVNRIDMLDRAADVKADELIERSETMIKYSQQLLADLASESS
jgi:hypothetical protein